jgi:peptide deformylase
MAVRPVLTYPDERLKRVATPVEAFDAALRAAIADLEETLRAGPAAVGIAAPQIGWTQRVVIIDASAKPQWRNHGRLVLVNPAIIAHAGAVTGREGCLSVPDYTGNVVRAQTLTLEARDEDGRLRRYEMEGFEARVAQHEIDHLDGLLFVDRVVSRRNDLFRRKVYR